MFPIAIRSMIVAKARLEDTALVPRFLLPCIPASSCQGMPSHPMLFLWNF